MFDTHCHLNFKQFNNSIPDVIQRANNVGVTGIIVPGTDIITSYKAVEIVSQYEGVYAAVGIHPHHAIQDQKLQVKSQTYASKFQSDIEELKKLLMHPKVVAIGEVGLDKYEYKQTKYQIYKVSDEFVKAQKLLLIAQIKLALEFDKSLILHNREAKMEMLPLLETYWDKKLEGRTVFHCCEPDLSLLDFAQKHGIFLGVDGDVTYSATKAQFIKKVPLEMLVVETDSPYLLPEPLRSKNEYPRFDRKARQVNEPKNIPIIVSYISNVIGRKNQELEKILLENTLKLFHLN